MAYDNITVHIIMIFISVFAAEPKKCQTLEAIHLPTSGGYIGKQTLEDTGLYVNDCLWSLLVKPGQRILVTLLSFLYGQDTEEIIQGKYHRLTLVKDVYSFRYFIHKM